MWHLAIQTYKFRRPFAFSRTLCGFIRQIRRAEPLLLVVFLSIVPVVQAQSRGPHIGYVYPAGGRQNDAFQVEIGGQYLDGADRVYVSGKGVRVTVIDHVGPLTGQQRNELQLRLRDLQKQQTDPAIRKEMAEIRARLDADDNRNIYPVLSENVACLVMVAPDAEPGERELRLQVAGGLSNPLTFCIGQLPEVREKEWKGSTADAPMGVTVPVTINGRIVPGSIEQDRLLRADISRICRPTWTGIASRYARDNSWLSPPVPGA